MSSSNKVRPASVNGAPRSAEMLSTKKVMPVNAGGAAISVENNFALADTIARRSSMRCIDGGDLIILGDSADNADTDKTLWKCKKCGKTNKLYIDQCISCLEYRSPDCKVITADEEMEDDYVPITSIDLEDDIDDFWTCRRCTLKNSLVKERCEVCEAPKQNNVPIFIPDSCISNCDVVDITSGSENDETSNAQRRTAVKRRKIVEADKETTWTCNCCTFNNNPLSTDVCDMCQTVKQVYVSPERKPSDGASGITWKCSKCLSANSNAVRDCAFCGALRFQAQSHAVPETWVCVRCTLVNNAVAHVCGACRAKRNTVLPSVDELSLVANHWSCPTCTCINDNIETKCQACHYDKRTLPGSAGSSSTDSSSSKRVTSSDTASGSKSPCHHLQRTNSMQSEKRRLEEESTAREQWTRIVLFCKENHEEFVDSDFPPTAKSLYYNGISRSDHRVADWRRPIHVVADDDCSQPWTVLDAPKPSDICQGVLGNCWFLSALAVIVERPSLLEHILVTRQYCEQGVYQIRLCKNGNWTTVVIDDLLPCDKYGRLIYSQSKRKQLWVPLIEKAFAKIHGCYQALTAGWCIEGLSTLTGAPCSRIPLSDPIKSEDNKDLIWAQLLSSRESGFLMGTSCGGGNMKVDDKVYEELGLIARHAYSVLDVQIIEGYRLLRLRNPWGRFSWKGDWSRISDNWKQLSKASRDKWRPLGSEEGVFWMSFDDLLRYFDVVDICKYRSDWMESRQKIVLPSLAIASPIVTQIEIFEPTEVEFGLHQEDARGKEQSKRNPVDLCICIFHTDGRGSIGPLVCHSKRAVQSFIGTSHLFEPGFYLVFTMAFNHWSAGGSANVNAVLTVHSSKAHLLDSLPMAKTCLADAIIQLAVARGERHEGREGMTTYYLTRNWSGFIMVIENRHPDSALHVQCDCSESINVVSTRCALKTVDAIPALHRQVVIILSQLEARSGYSLTHRLVHRYCSVGTGLGDWAPGANHVPALTQEIYGLHAARPL